MTLFYVFERLAEQERSASLKDPSPMTELDAVYECKHGSLPTDRTIECDCWAAAGTSSVELDRSADTEPSPAVRTSPDDAVDSSGPALR